MTTCLYGQGARLVLNGDPYVVFDTTSAATTYIVVDNPATDAITTTPAGRGNIVSEREKNRIRWTQAATTGTYTIPFTTRSNVKIPLVVTKTTTGAVAATSSMVFATYNWKGTTTSANAWNNLLYKPSDVTHMNDYPTGSVNNSANAVDRFWIIDPSQATFNYTTLPAVTLTFNYDPAELVAPNTATAATIGAQRFKTATQQWGDMMPQGTAAAGQVSGAAIAAGDFFRSWTLASVVTPLPIQLVAWNGTCKGETVELSWTTASEQDNDHFTIEKSADAATWTEIGQVQGAGNHSGMLHYSFIDQDGKGLAYYRLSQTDLDGTTATFDVIAAGCDAPDGIEIVNAWDDGDDLNVVVSSTLDGMYDLSLMDTQGKVMTVRPSQVINTGATTLKVNKGTIATGVYVVQLQNASNVMTRRVILR